MDEFVRKTDPSESGPAEKRNGLSIRYGSIERVREIDKKITTHYARILKKLAE